MHPIKHGREKEKHLAGLFLGMVCIEGLKWEFRGQSRLLTSHMIILPVPRTHQQCNKC